MPPASILSPGLHGKASPTRDTPPHTLQEAQFSPTSGKCCQGLGAWRLEQGYRMPKDRCLPLLTTSELEGTEEALPHCSRVAANRRGSAWRACQTLTLQARRPSPLLGTGKVLVQSYRSQSVAAAQKTDHVKSNHRSSLGGTIFRTSSLSRSEHFKL